MDNFSLYIIFNSNHIQPIADPTYDDSELKKLIDDNGTNPHLNLSEKKLTDQHMVIVAGILADNKVREYTVYLSI